jgi:hypothetical protein
MIKFNVLASLSMDIYTLHGNEAAFGGSFHEQLNERGTYIR